MERTGGLAVALLAFMKENLFHNLVGPLLISDILEIGGVPSDDRDSVGEKNMGKFTIGRLRQKQNVTLCAFNSCYHDD